MILRGAKVLVSGGTGFIGSHLVHRLTAEGARVHLLVRGTSSAERLTGLDPAPVRTCVELDDQDGLRDVVRNVRPDLVFLAAGSTSERGRQGSAGEAAASRSYLVNVIGTLHLLHAISIEAPAARVIRVGTLAEYGTGAVPFHEDQREQPASPYAASQLAATHLGQSFFRQMGLPVTTLRLALTYGPAQSSSFLIPSLIAACLEGRPFTLTSADCMRDLIYVDDVVDALMAASQAPGVAGEIVNIGSGSEYKVGDVAATIVSLSGSRIELRSSSPSDPTELKWVVCNPHRAGALLGWNARTPLEEGLKRTIAWHRSHRST